MMLSYIKTVRYIHDMMKRAYWPRSKLLDYQNKRLRHLIRHSYESVSFYHERFRRANVRPEDIRTIQDLNRLPIVRKNEIKGNSHSFVSREYEISSLRPLLTSGSTGTPLQVLISRDEDSFRKAKHLRANLSCGHMPFDRWVTITSPSHFSETTKLQRTLGIYAPRFVSVFDQVPKQLSTIEKMRPEVLDGYSSSLFLLAKEIERSGSTVIKPKIVFGGAELTDNASRDFIEKTLNVPFYDQYATIEFERMAWQCTAKSCYHMDSDAIVMQFVDQNGEEVSEGESGEVICTSLFSYAMPFIRYAVGDIGTLSSGECSCGRQLPLMKIIEGRSDSLLLLPKGRTLSPRTFTIAVNKFSLSRYFEQFRVIQKKTDYFKIQIKIQGDSTKKTAIEAGLPVHLKKMLNVETDEIRFEIEFVDEIPLDKSGKLMIVTSELGQNTLVKG